MCVIYSATKKREREREKIYNFEEHLSIQLLAL